MYNLKIFIASIFLLCSLSSLMVFAQEKAPYEVEIQSVIRDQLSAFQTGDHERAFSHAAPTIKQIFKNTENFVGMVRNGYAPLYNPETFTFSRSLQQGGTMYQEVLVTDQNGKQWQAVYTLKEIDGVWKITGVKMDPYNGAST